MKKRYFKLIAITIIALLPFWTVTGGICQDKESPKHPEIKITTKAPRANIEINDNKVSIEIEGLDLSTEEANRLKKEIEDEVEIDKIPKGLDMKMNLRITDEILDRAGIKDKDGKGFHFKLNGSWSDDDDDDDDDDNDKFGLADIDINTKRDGDTVKISKDLTVRAGEKYKDIVVINGNLDFAGKANDVVVILGDAKIHPGAKIRGDFVVLFGSSDVSKEAKISGEQVNIGGASGFLAGILRGIVIPSTVFSDSRFSIFSIFGKLFFWIILFGFSFLLFKISPETTDKVKIYLKENIPASLGIGVLGLVLTVTVTLFLALSIIGIPLLPVFAVLVFVMLFFGFAVAAHFIGNLFPLKSVKNRDIWALLIGIMILMLVSMIPLIGCTLKYVVVTTGFGAVCFIMFEMVFRKKKNKNGGSSVEASTPTQS